MSDRAELLQGVQLFEGRTEYMYYTKFTAIPFPVQSHRINKGSGKEISS
jgi:hypothetical protein